MSKIQTPESIEIIPQVTDFGNIQGLRTTDFNLNGKNFLIKNENIEDLWLEVKPALSQSFVKTKFIPGWNIELVKEVKKDATLTVDQEANIKWGY